MIYPKTPNRANILTPGRIASGILEAINIQSFLLILFFKLVAATQKESPFFILENIFFNVLPETGLLVQYKRQ